MKRLVIIQKSIPHYRIDFFLKLSQIYDLIVIYSDPNCSTKFPFKTKYIETLKFWQLEIHKKLIPFIINSNPHKVIIMMDLHFPVFIIIALMNKFKRKIIWWGPWMTKNEIANRVRLNLMKSTPSILYSESHKKQFIQKGIDSQKLIVANNTIHISRRLKSYKYNKKHFLFVGSFNKRKGIHSLLNAYETFLQNTDSDIKLILIGDGEIFCEVKRRTQLSKILLENVYLVGRVEKEKDLLPYFKNCLANISINQAGLSILQSFAYGVPFITLKTAISGGETNNIINGKTGFLCKDLLEVIEKMKYLHFNRSNALELGKNCYEFYTQKATLENMINSFRIIVDVE